MGPDLYSRINVADYSQLNTQRKQGRGATYRPAKSATPSSLSDGSEPYAVWLGRFGALAEDIVDMVD